MPSQNSALLVLDGFSSSTAFHSNQHPCLWAPLVELRRQETDRNNRHGHCYLELSHDTLSTSHQFRPVSRLCPPEACASAAKYSAVSTLDCNFQQPSRPFHSSFLIKTSRPRLSSTDTPSYRAPVISLFRRRRLRPHGRSLGRRHLLSNQHSSFPRPQASFYRPGRSHSVGCYFLHRPPPITLALIVGYITASTIGPLATSLPRSDGVSPNVQFLGLPS